MFIGNFNQIVNVEERLGHMRVNGGMRLFIEWINNR